MIVDAHCDTALYFMKACAHSHYCRNENSLRRLDYSHEDYERVARYLDIAFYAIFVDEKEFAADLRGEFDFLFDKLRADIAANGDLVEALLWREDLPLLGGAGGPPKRILIGAEGAGFLGENAAYLPEAYAKGLRLIGLTWNYANQFAAGCALEGGLTAAGRQLVADCNRLGIIVDAAHLSAQAFWDVLEAAQKPFIVSHSCCAALHTHKRNLDADQIRALAKAKGVMGITFADMFLGGEPSIARICEHIEYAVEVGGIDHVGIGSDFDGCDLPPDLNGIEGLSLIWQALCERGWQEDDIAKVAGLNFYRVLREVLPVKA
jgi:membrane dipeptidase